MGRLSRGTGALLIMLALFFDFILDPLFDLFTAGLLGGMMVNVIATPVFWLILKPRGIDMFAFGSGYGAGTLATLILESMPEINILPSWTVRMVTLVIQEGAFRGGL